MSSAVKQEFFRWIAGLDNSKLTDIDRKLLNLLVTHLGTLAPLSTAQGGRAKKINELIQKHHQTLSTEFPNVLSNQSVSSEKFDRITELKIGPFRGFATNELFTFDKKYTFMYGPNGSGKSSFCEGLEYALLGGVEEAEAKRIPINEYVKNTKKGSAVLPSAYTVNNAGQKVQIPQNQALYRFAFIEKNRIDGFARITATTASAQKDRIATLFGLDAFSTFVDGFTDDIEKYLTLSNVKADAFKLENQNYEVDVARVSRIDSELLENAEKIKELIQETAQENVSTLEALRLFLTGPDGITGYIGNLQRQKTEVIPEDLKTDVLDTLPMALTSIRSLIEVIDKDMNDLTALSSDVNFKELYSAIESIGSDSNTDFSRCPACKTPIENVVTNPFENSKRELQKLKNLSELQKSISETSNILSREVRSTISTITAVNELSKGAGQPINTLPGLTEFVFTNIAAVKSWKPVLETELVALANHKLWIEAIRGAVLAHNTALSLKRAQQKKVDDELIKYQDFNTRLIELTASCKSLEEEKTKRQKAILDFTTSNAKKLIEIEEESTRIAINQQYADAYKRLIRHLKLTRDHLPVKLSGGLSEKVRDYYNTVNAHDPDFELLDSLMLPATAGAKMEIKFQGDSRTHDVLQILSEGHIKVLGLSILLAKAVKEDLGFLIFDDIVNAIDDDHRGGIADLLLCHCDLKDRQHILTCHGETFINKLEHKLGASEAGKHVKSYRFIPADIVTTRGVQVSIGDSKHYLVKAKESLEKNNLKDAGTDCRRAVESISYQLWKILDKRLKINLKVTMRAPGVPPDLSTVVDSLLKELSKISGADGLQENLTKLKEKYPWSLLNTGVHEDEKQPEFERKDISELIQLAHTIEQNVSAVKLTVASA